MGASSKQKVQDGVINLLPSLLLALGILGGLGAGVWQYRVGSRIIFAWVENKSGWELAAFGAFGTMSGFGMAALALIATLSAHSRGEEAIDSNSGRMMVRWIVRSTWSWLVPGLVALLHMIYPASFVRAIFIGISVFASAQGVLALLGLTFFFRRFTISRPS